MRAFRVFTTAMYECVPSQMTLRFVVFGIGVCDVYSFPLASDKCMRCQFYDDGGNKFSDNTTKLERYHLLCYRPGAGLYSFLIINCRK